MSLDLTSLPWQLSGWRPYAWKHARSVETTFWLEADIAAMPARLPGSVQQNLRDNGLLTDWHIGFASREVEWVEHRHWVFTCTLSAEQIATLRAERRVFLHADSLDYSGWVLVNGKITGTFSGPHQPAAIELTTAIATLDAGASLTLGLVFDCPPEAYGQIGYSSDTTFLKPRYNFSWDWCPRLVPLGAWGALRLETDHERSVSLISCSASVSADLSKGEIEVRLEAEAATLPLTVELTVAGSVSPRPITLAAGANILRLDVPRPALWWPRGEGEQALHELAVIVRDASGAEVRRFTRTLGFKHVEWRHNPGAPADALPWLCVVNGRPIFLQGVNWTPIRLAYQDTTPAEYARLVGLYRDMGCNLLRVWGGAFLEAPEFYDECDRAGLLVWQEFPLSSSGLDNQPPHAPAVVTELRDIARHFIRARRHHASLLLWCGGNELQDGLEHEKHFASRPCDLSDPCLAVLGSVVTREDPGRRFLPTSPSGPLFYAKRENFGKGLHHHVHGPWGFGDFPTYADWETYWENDDSTLRSETGLASANSLDLLHRHAAGAPLWPPTTPIWKHSASWWTQDARLTSRFAHLPPDEALAAYVEHTRLEQAEGLAHAARCSKNRFPRCGGFMVWMGHDCFPCPANTSIIDFDHQPKPVWHALREVFLAPAGPGVSG
ncbi:MAG: hypothetical protein MUE42_00645 [Opitutaceae bacterium]|nr:hypothetical protein [Opitutaceae bacterium]